MKRFLVICSFGLIYGSVNAQRIGSFLPVEKALLELLSRDTTEQLVTVMPMSYRFGIRDMSFDRISILKLGGRILLLPDGQDAVFQWRSDLGKLVRIDSSRFSGSNFGMMPFIRKGQAWQFGGYGFWRSRNMFTRFDDGMGQWTFECSDPSVTGHLTLYFYDPVSDALYMCGSYRNQPHDMHRTDFYDGVFMFDFRHRKWSRLGKIALVSNPTELTNALHLRNTAVFGAGLIHVMGSQTTLYDFGHNVHSRIRVGSDTALLRIGVLSGQYDRAWEHCIMMGDSLVIIHANEDKASINKLYLKSEMFEPIGQIWSDDAERSGASTNIRIFAVGIFGLLFFGGCWYLLSRNSHILKSPFRSAHIQHDVESLDHDTVDWAVFWKGLRPGHQVLLRYLVLEGNSEQGVAADALNHVLGISRRPPDLQKVHRNRAIQSINQVYQQTFRTEAMLIERLKDSSDRRQTRFCISRENQHLLGNYFKS